MSDWTRRQWLQGIAAAGAGCATGLAANSAWAQAAIAQTPTAATWPPDLNGAEKGSVTLKGEDFLRVPKTVQETREKEGAAPFSVAAAAPTVELAFQGNLGNEAAARRLWSSWGDICVAQDGRVYVAIGDHGGDAEGDARCFLYRWDPKKKSLEQIVDMNQVVPPREGQPAWSKVHAKIDEGADGKIYFSCTLNDGQRASTPKYAFNAALPGGQLYQFDPATGRTAVHASLPPRRCTATSLLDRQRNLWWCNLEAGKGDSLWALDLETRQPKFQTPEGTVKFNRNFAPRRDGSIFFNGDGGLWKFDPATGTAAATKSTFEAGPGIRCSTHESRRGHIYGITHQAHQLFRYTPAGDALQMLGPNWLAGSYTAVCVLSPDERFVYYLPGSHGGAFKDGTPVVQYEVASGRRKVLAFLSETIEKAYRYVPAGTYGAKLSADGGTLYVNFNGHPADSIRPAKMRPNGFGLCSFMAIHIPVSER